MAPNIVSIGPVALQQFEVPQSIRFGGRYRVGMHLLAGGGRILEPLGPDDDEIDFEGAFSGASAIERARSIDMLRLSGQPILLIWPTFARLVIITQFVADFRSPSWIPYQLACTVVNQPLPAAALIGSIATLISTDMSAAATASIGTSVSLTSLQTALTAPNALVARSAAHSDAKTAVSGVLGALNICVDQQSALLAAGLSDTTDAQQLAASLINASAAAGILAASTNTRSYVGRINTNLQILDA